MPQLLPQVVGIGYQPTLSLSFTKSSLVAQITHQGRDFFQVTGPEDVCHVYVNLMNMQVEETLNVDMDQPSAITTSWCSCGTFLMGLLTGGETQMVGRAGHSNQ